MNPGSSKPKGSALKRSSAALISSSSSAAAHSSSSETVQHPINDDEFEGIRFEPSSSSSSSSSSSRQILPSSSPLQQRVAGKAIGRPGQRGMSAILSQQRPSPSPPTLPHFPNQHHRMNEEDEEEEQGDTLPFAAPSSLRDEDFSEELSSSSSSSSSALAVSSLRPTQLTRHGIRQFVETQHGVRLFLQNCVASCDLHCAPDLAHIACHAKNAEYNPQRFSAVIMRLREPKCTALIFASGKMVITGAKNEDDSHLAAKKFAAVLVKLGFGASLGGFKIQNVVATGDCTWPIRLEGLADEHSKFSSYEPELFPGLIYRMESPRIVILVFVSGKLVVTGAKDRSMIIEGINKLYPTLYKFRKAAT